MTSTATAEKAPEIYNILRATHTEEFSYDRDKVLEAANWLAEGDFIKIPLQATLDDIILLVFEFTYDSEFGRDLFYGLDDFNAGCELFTRQEGD